MLFVCVAHSDIHHVLTVYTSNMAGFLYVTGIACTEVHFRFLVVFMVLFIFFVVVPFRIFPCYDVLYDFTKNKQMCVLSTLFLLSNIYVAILFYFASFSGLFMVDCIIRSYLTFIIVYSYIYNVNK